MAPLEEDKTPVPKCDARGPVRLDVRRPQGAGSQEKETKTITTVGEFVRWCIEPSLQRMTTVLHAATVANESR